MTGCARPLPLPRPIDPFAGSSGGVYEDDAVVVVRRDSLAGLPGEDWTTTTPHFALRRERDRLVLLHALRPGAVDNDVAMLLQGELFAPGWAGGADTFERLMTGVVLSCHDDALTSWEGFYRTTLDRLRALVSAEVDVVDPDPGQQPWGDGHGEGTLAAFAPVYRHARDLVREAGTRTLLDLGTCFGFFPLLLAGAAAPDAPLLQAADITPGTCDLLAQVSLRLGAPVPVLVCDAACVPLPDAVVDTVTLLHVLEHVEARHGRAILAEATRLARRRVIVAVPLEEEPDAAFGHVRAISSTDLARWGARLAHGGGWDSRVEEYHGGWLVLDRLPTDRR